MSEINIPKISSFKTPAEFRSHLRSLGIKQELDDTIESAPVSPMAQKIKVYSKELGNRWCILPMEGWDCESDGAPSELTRRRWHNFAISGAKLLFGCEACAVMESGRSNTRQLMLTDSNASKLGALLDEMRATHTERFGTADDTLIGLQLTHSGRYSHPNDDAKLESVTAYPHPLLDERFHCSSANVISDSEIPNVVRHFAKAAKLSQKLGFDFVDVKMAHGYLGHEFLSAFTRPGNYGGSFENRTRFFREIVEAIREAAPGLAIATRLSLFDCIPFEPGADRRGIPMERGDVKVGSYPYAFGGDGTGLGKDLTETKMFLELCCELGIELVCTTVCSPYYNPHFQRPAYFPVWDGYLPPEDPVAGACRQIETVAELKKEFGDRIKLVGSGYSCLQEYMVNIAQRVVRDGQADFVGIGRQALAYPEICADSLEGTPLKMKKLCRTFGDCTTAPRNGLVSGCYPLDPFYKVKKEAEILKARKRELAERLRKN